MQIRVNKLLVLITLFVTISCGHTQGDEQKKSLGTLEGNIKSCVCPKLWMPVCGENQKTYGNTCEANCVGVKYTQGKCEEKQ